MKINRLAGIAAFSLLVCLAEEPKKEAKQKPLPAGAAGMVIVRTPDGGLRAPTPEEQRQLTGQGSSTLQLTAEPQQQVLGGGRGVRVQLDPATTSVFSIAKIGPDGKLVLQEAVGQKAADRLVKGAAPAAGPEKKEAAQ